MTLSLSLLMFGCSTSVSREIAQSSKEKSGIWQVEDVVSSLKKEILSQKKKDHQGLGYYNMSAYLGTLYTSTYFLSLMWTNDFWNNSKYVDLATEYKQILYQTQNQNGGWYRVLDANLTDSSDLSATIMNYWFLKAIGEDIESYPLEKAREYILSHGSIEKSDILTKIFCSLFENYAWKKIPEVSSPNVFPFAILRKTHPSKLLDEKLSLEEFMDGKKRSLNRTEAISKSDIIMIAKLIDKQMPSGSWEGNLISSIFARLTIALTIETSTHIPKATLAKSKAEDLMDKYLFDSGSSYFLGVTQDSHIGDTILLTNALIEAGTDVANSHDSLKHILTFQSVNGGIPNGIDFEQTPDVDDTAIMLTTLARVRPANDPYILKGLSFLNSMQNKDGGFSAISKKKNGNFLLNHFIEPLKESSDLIDESSSDITGHVIEAYGSLGLTDKNSSQVKKALEYLRKTQNEEGAFYGRWGINYLYGTSIVLAGVSEVGLSAKDPLVKQALKWLLSKQNIDGGFGESTLSYSQKAWEGKGQSTPTQTAWALIGLLKYLPAEHPSIKKAVDFLILNFSENNYTFIDQSVTGTGQPMVYYKVYPAYAKAFPLMALSRYLKKLAK
jgi:squalene-hopene/tetraprenyl-beta-curcumene cyclase